MKIRAKKFAWTAIATSVALTSGAPALADDTELLLSNPNNFTQPKPNILFILDTSGSMKTEEQTVQPYDSSVTYAGNCDINQLYWSDTGVEPVCDGNETQFIQKSAFFCEAATQQIAGIGSFSNTMVQWRTSPYLLSGTWVDVYWWDTFVPGNDTGFVECEADRGKHGNGTAGDVYATAYGWYGGIGVPWVADPGIELSWGSAPRNVEYTVYDGNYLNWKASPLAVQLSRAQIVREVTKTVLQSVNDVNVGVMRFNDRDGGPVIQAVVDLDTNRQSIINTIDSLGADGATPLSETLYESALYWMGQPAYFGEKINENPTDPNALVSNTPEVYKSPILDACAKNYNVLLTDGEPVNDDETPTLAPTLPGFTSVTGKTVCDGTGMGHCLDDVAEYLALADTDGQQAGPQNVATHTIGFAIDLPILAETAQKSGGKYFLADDVQSLTLALLSIVNDITDKSQAFSAPAVSVNTFNRTQNLNDIYLTMFGVRPKVHWPGNLKKYRITNRVITDSNNLAAVDPATGFFVDTARSFWSGAVDGNDVLKGGAAENLPDPSQRNLYTNNSSNNLSDVANQIISSNGTLQASDFGLTGAAGEPTKDELIRWMRGEDIRDEDGNSNTNIRYAMGDPLHSQPASIVYGGTVGNPDVVVYTATNDGYLHAINGTTGEELWSFVPKDLLPNMTRLFFDPDSKFKNYGLDGNIVPVVKDENKNGIVDGNDFVRIIVGMRRGGSNYYALDVTNKYAPRLMWAVSPAEVSQSWSTPVVTRVVAPGGNADNTVVIFGAGYDAAHDTNQHPAQPDAAGAAVVMLDLESGAELWRASRNAANPNDLNLSTMTRAIPGEVRVIDLTGNGYADRMYAADMGGQILRFDIHNGTTGANFVTGGVIAQLGAEGLGGVPLLQDTRRFYASPDVSMFTSERLDKRFLSISIGSGYRAHPLDNINVDRFYSVRDADVFNSLSQTQYDNYPIVYDSALVEVAGQKDVQLSATDRGWRFTLPADQKVLSDSITFDNSVFFVAFSPQTNTNNVCAPGAGTNFLYRVSVVNGDPIVPDIAAVTDPDAARRQTLQQGGIAPTPTILFPSPDDPSNCTGAACSPPPIYCVGVECGDPDYQNNPVRTLWTQDGIL